MCPGVLFGCDTISSTSFELFCMMSTASLKETPSRLIWLREISRPPEEKIRQDTMWDSQLVIESTLAMVSCGTNVFYSLLLIPKKNNKYRWSGMIGNDSPGLMRPSRSAGPPGTMDAMKIPRSSLPALSSPTITIPWDKICKENIFFIFFETHSKMIFYWFHLQHK